MFCVRKCEDTFNQLPKEEKRKAMKQYRDSCRERRRKIEFKEMIEFLIKMESGSLEKKPFTKQEAEKEAKHWIYKQGKSFRLYKKVFGL